MRTTIITAVTLSVLGLSICGAQTAPPSGAERNAREAPSPGQKPFEQGRAALLTGDYAKAVKLLSEAVATDPAKTSYRLYLARAHRYAGKPAQAEEALKAILKTAPDHVEAGQLLGEIFAARKSWKEVVALLEPLLKFRHDYTTYHLLARATYHLDDHGKARKYFEEAIKLNPNSAADHVQLANIYLGGNFYALAAGAYEKALSLGADSPVLRYKLGSAYFNLRNYFGRVAEVTVKAGVAETLSGSWYLIEPVPGKKDVFRSAPPQSAIYQVAKAMTMGDGIAKRPDIKLLKANIYLRGRRHQRAYEMFKAIEKIVPKEDKALFYYYYAQAAYGTGRHEEYLKLLDEAIKLDKAAYEPTRVEAYLKVAEQHNQAGRLDKYVHYLKLAVAASPQTASLHLKLGDAYVEGKQYAQAVVQFRMVLDLEPDHAQRLDLLNRISKYGRLAAAAKPAT